MQKRRPVDGSGAVLLASIEQPLSTANQTAPQPDSVCKLQALHLIAHRHVRPAMALTLAALCFGSRADG